MTNSPKQSAEELRKKVADAYGSGRTKAETAVRTVKHSSRNVARTAKKSGSEGLENNPLIAVAGGLALGAIVAALLPGTKREGELLGKAGKRIRSTASNAAKAARDVGKEQLDSLGVNSGAAREQLRGVVEKIGQAAAAASKAATDAVRQKP